MSAKQGGCMCDGVRYEVVGEPLEKNVCHCPWCKKLSGAVFTSQMMVLKENYKIIKGTPKHFSIEHKGVSYGNAFCPDCGATVYRSTGSFPEVLVVKLGTLDKLEDQTWAKPDREIYVSERVGWVPRFVEEGKEVWTLTNEIPGYGKVDIQID
ncbi:hypothetical protein FANTH_14587 [Fusarium anthophilum]|uniref:CENP-V/GFA domain-containing protein n=1 Tax=Fusarium anthophilum TaxID=48485 RepID=A0A8H5DLU7_9HYPO|nr:hypothetical protein FANTH_14587 [Fusarium anthophilum]